jgi:hypothetical protein
MKRLIKICVAVSLLLIATSVTAVASDYYIWNDHGGAWADADKSGGDSNMCWAAAASNILEWTGLGKVGGMTTAGDIFGYFKSHWTNVGGEMEDGWNWWFTGINPNQGVPFYSQVVVQGGNFYPSLNFSNYFHEMSGEPCEALSTVDQYLHDGYGTTLSIGCLSGAHAITCWGFQYDSQYDPANPNYYTGIYVTDSDDNYYGLQYYPVEYSNGEWYLQGRYSNWFITDVQALAAPEPAMICLLGLGALSLIRRKRGV